MNFKQIVRNILWESSDEWSYSSLSKKKSKPSDKDPWNESGIQYTAVKIEDPSEILKLERALIEIGFNIPKNWISSKDYHMTISLGPLSLRRRIQDVGQEVELDVISF